MLESINFSASATILKRLGDELIKDSNTAFFELVKNSYDADATNVFVKFHKVLNTGGSIIIQDDGTGMNEIDIKTKWARAAGENKVKEPYTPKYNRRRLGEKGIGRFSLAKLGNKVKVITRPENSHEQYVFNIDFEDFTDDKNFDEMKINYNSGKPRIDLKKGTILEINDLKEKWSKKEIRKAKNRLSLLIDPEKSDQNFNIYFECSDYPEFTGLIESPLAGDESHILQFEINDLGEYKRKLTVENNELIFKENMNPLECGPVEGIIRYYKDGIKSTDRKLSEDESHTGVKIYRDGCRVRPYGEEFDDWLEIKSKRSRSGGKYYIHANLIAGSIYISSLLNPKLIDATNREAGIIENEEYFALKYFIEKQIYYLNTVLDQENRSESQKQKRQTVQNILDTIVKCLNNEESDIYSNYIENIDRGKAGNHGITTKKKESRVQDLKIPLKEEWQCNDCKEFWRVKKNIMPNICMEFAVDREGILRDIIGCGSSNIERAKHQPKSKESDLTSIIAGSYALIAGKQLKLRVDYDMGAKDDEFTINEREIIVNGNHITYKVAEHLDRVSGKKYEIGDDVFVPALTIHISKCACLAWAEFHYKESGDWFEYKSRYENLQNNIFIKVKSEINF